MRVCADDAGAGGDLGGAASAAAAGRWLAAASLAYGLAVGARPSLLFGAVILLVPVVQAWREKRPGWPIACWRRAARLWSIGLGLMLYNVLRFDNPLEFGQRYQLPVTGRINNSVRATSGSISGWRFWRRRIGAVFSLRAGHCVARAAEGLFQRGSSLWRSDQYAAGLAGAGGAAGVAGPGGGAAPLCAGLWRRWLCFSGCCALTLLPPRFHGLRYELEYASPLVLLAVIGVLAVERALAGQPVWRRAARCGWGLLLAFSVAFNLLESFTFKPS